jgi:hypothetical protein
MYREDVVGLATENYPEAVPLLHCVMRQGKRVITSPSMQQIQRCAREELDKLPPACRRLHQPQSYPVSFSSDVKNLLAVVRRQVENGVA